MCVCVTDTLSEKTRSSIPFQQQFRGNRLRYGEKPLRMQFFDQNATYKCNIFCLWDILPTCATKPRFGWNSQKKTDSFCTINATLNSVQENMISTKQTLAHTPKTLHTWLSLTLHYPLTHMTWEHRSCVRERSVPLYHKEEKILDALKSSDPKPLSGGYGHPSLSTGAQLIRSRMGSSQM